jgi:phospholipid/cholesterol/gamma-HCH transport system substrate-binding protein
MTQNQPGKGSLENRPTRRRGYRVDDRSDAEPEDAHRSIKCHGHGGKLMTDPALFNQLKSLTDRLDLLAKRLNDGEGSLGQLLKDRQLYENMNGAVNDVRSLIVEIKKDPKRYLNVRISIF